VHQLDALDGAKQVKLVDPTLQKVGDFAPALQGRTAFMQQGTSQHDYFYYLTNVVDNTAIFDLMAQAQRGLERKARKYSQEDAWDYYGTSWAVNHPEVPRVLAHLAGLLGLELTEPSVNWRRLREDGVIADDMET
jgi:hypothetical protein